MKRLLLALTIALALVVPSAADASSIPYNCGSCGNHNTSFDLTYTVVNPALNTYNLTITATYQPAGAGTPDFTYINDIAFQFQGVTYENGTPQLLAGPSEDTWSIILGGIAASGCNGSGNFFCLSSLGFGATHPGSFAGTIDTWTLFLDLPSNIRLGSSAPIHLKAHFTDAQGRRVGSLISNDGTAYETCANGPCTPDVPTTPVPEPASLVLLGSGLTVAALRLRRGARRS